MTLKRHIIKSLIKIACIKSAAPVFSESDENALLGFPGFAPDNANTDTSDLPELPSLDDIFSSADVTDTSVLPDLSIDTDSPTDSPDSPNAIINNTFGNDEWPTPQGFFVGADGVAHQNADTNTGTRGISEPNSESGNVVVPPVQASNTTDTEKPLNGFAVGYDYDDDMQNPVSTPALPVSALSARGGTSETARSLGGSGNTEGTGAFVNPVLNAFSQYVNTAKPKVQSVIDKVNQFVASANNPFNATNATSELNLSTPYYPTFNELKGMNSNDMATRWGNVGRRAVGTNTYNQIMEDPDPSRINNLYNTLTQNYNKDLASGELSDPQRVGSYAYAYAQLYAIDREHQRRYNLDQSFQPRFTHPVKGRFGRLFNINGALYDINNPQDPNHPGNMTYPSGTSATPAAPQESAPPKASNRSSTATTPAPLALSNRFVTPQKDRDLSYAETIASRYIPTVMERTGQDVNLPENNMYVRNTSMYDPNTGQIRQKTYEDVRNDANRAGAQSNYWQGQYNNQNLSSEEREIARQKAEFYNAKYRVAQKRMLGNPNSFSTNPQFQPKQPYNPNQQPLVNFEMRANNAQARANAHPNSRMLQQRAQSSQRALQRAQSNNNNMS